MTILSRQSGAPVRKDGHSTLLWLHQYSFADGYLQTLLAHGRW